MVYRGEHTYEYQPMQTSWKKAWFSQKPFIYRYNMYRANFLNGWKKNRLVIVVCHCGSYNFYQASGMNEPVNQGGSSLPVYVLYQIIK